MKTIQTDHYTISLDDQKNSSFDNSLTYEKVSQGIETITLFAKSETPQIPEGFTLRWFCPIEDIHCRFSTQADRALNLPPDWADNYTVSAASGAPILSYYSFSGENKMTVCASDCVYETCMKGGVYEENASLYIKFTFLNDIVTPIKDYSVTLRIDTRPVPYYEAVKNAVSWIETLPNYTPAPVPESAKLPMYSTWYSFHQDITPKTLLNQCQLAKEIGCDTIIVDDGWQTDDNSRGYSFCGDWEVCKNKIPDMKKFVGDVHKTGLKIMLWYSVPFLGIHAKAYKRFSDKVLKAPDAEWYVLDVRFPEVRDYLIQTYVNAVKNYGLDGFKLDFIDCFRITEYSKDQIGESRDYVSLPEALDRLMKDILSALRAINPDILIEFRQDYIGPLMRTYGNMLRASDCPNDSIANRNRILNLRLISGKTAIHSDMLMWNYNDTVESAAMQLLQVFFSVPQISVLIDKLSKEHYAMLKFLLSFWRKNKDVLLDGELVPLYHETLYGAAISATSEKILAISYSCPIEKFKRESQKVIHFINARMQEGLYIDASNGLGFSFYQIYDCMGNLVEKGNRNLSGGIHYFNVPKAGILSVEFAK